MVRLLCYLSISMVCCWARGTVRATESQQVLRGQRVAVEVAVKDGRPRERYLAIRNGAWVEVASSDPAQTLGPVSAISGGKPLDGSAEAISLRNGTLTEELAMDDHRVVRKLTIQGEGPWIRVDARLQPSGRLSLHQLSTPFAWKHQPVVVFRRTEPTRRYRLVVNGFESGTWQGDDLEKGVAVSFAKDQ